jgi:hypothetical protein
MVEVLDMLALDGLGSGHALFVGDVAGHEDGLSILTRQGGADAPAVEVDFFDRGEAVADQAL